MPPTPTRSSPDRGDDHAAAAAALEPGAWDRVGGRPAAWTFTVLFLAWMMVVFTVWTTWPGQDHGTRMADSNILNAGNVYAANGLTHRHAIPQLETYEDSERSPVLYGTYPPGPYWVHAVIRLSGIDSLAAIRGISVVGATLAGLLGMATFAVLARSWLVGAIAAGFYCFSSAFSGYADSVHMNVWMQIGLFWFLLAWVGFERARGPWRWLLLAVAGLAYFCEVWMTLEHIALIAIVVAVRTIISRRWSVWFGGAAMAAVCLGGLATRLLHLSLEYGTVQGAIDYLMRKYQHRSGEGTPGKSGVELAEVLTPWSRLLRWQDVAGDSRWSEFAYPFLYPPIMALMAGLLAVLLLSRIPATRSAIERARRQAAEVAASLGRHSGATRLTPREVAAAVIDSRVPAARAARAGLGWGVLLLLAAMHWHIVMRQHAAIHPHIILNMLPGMALILGSLATGGLRLAMPDARGCGWVRWLGLPLAAALMAVFATHIRDGAVLNRLFPLTALHTELKNRAAADQWWRTLGDSLREAYGPVNRLVLFHWGPRQANLIGLPHQYVEGGQMPASFGQAPAAEGADLLLIEFPRRQKTPQVILNEGFDRFGMPELAEGPESTTLIFSRSRPGAALPTTECDIRFAGGLRIDQIRLSPALVGDAYALCFLVRAPNAAALAPAGPVSADRGSGPGEALADDPLPPQAALPGGAMPRATLSALVRTFDASGARTGLFTPRLAMRATHRNRSLVWVFIDRDRLRDGGEVRITLIGQDREDRVPIERGRILPDGMSVDLEHDEIVWTIRLQQPPASGSPDSGAASEGSNR